MDKKKKEVVVITGASAGVGRAVARRFARDGASIGLIARGEQRLQATRKEIETLGGHALAISADVADAAALDSAAERVERELGPIDIWINNAMVSVFSPAREMQPEEYQRVTEVTYLGVVNGTLAALRRMSPRDCGTIVQIGSALAYRSIPLQSAYCAAKHAVVGFTDSLRCELIHDGSRVRLTVAHLPAVNTPQFEWCKSRMPRHPQPVPPIFQPEVVADGIYYAAHAHRREVWIGYPTVEAIVGQMVAPDFADRYLASNGYDAQMTSEPASPDRPDNLWQPAAGDFAAHGAFDARARSWSWQLALNMHRPLVVAAAAGVAALTVLFGRNQHQLPNQSAKTLRPRRKETNKAA